MSECTEMHLKAINVFLIIILRPPFPLKSRKYSKLMRELDCVRKGGQSNEDGDKREGEGRKWNWKNYNAEGWENACVMALEEVESVFMRYEALERAGIVFSNEILTRAPAGYLHCVQGQSVSGRKVHQRGSREKSLRSWSILSKIRASGKYYFTETARNLYAQSAKCYRFTLHL